MAACNLILCFLLCFAYANTEINTSCTENNAKIQGYYWRDFTEDIPPDAFVAGSDDQGNSVYVGQVSYSGYLFPGQINETDKKIHFTERGSEKITNKYVKILCTLYPGQLKWILTDRAEFDKTKKNKVLVLGGFSDEIDFFIGRVSLYGVTYVGRTEPDYLNAVKLHHSRNGNAFEAPVFEVLTYDPNESVKVSIY